MPAAAKICLQCKYSQSAIRNQLTLLAGLGGLIALLTYSISSLQEIRKNIWWRDAVDIVSIDPDNGVVIQNSGDGEIFVDAILLEADIEGGAKFSRSILIGEAIAPGKLIKHDSKQNTLDGAVMAFSATSKIKTVNDAFRMAKFSPNCLVPSIYSANSVRYRQYTKFMGDDLVQLHVKPKAIFYSGSPKPIEKEFNAVVLFLAAQTKEDCWK